ncbi:MAG: family 16 glycoside hydrolase, partial [Verrucomicrobiia bacterium]
DFEKQYLKPNDWNEMTIAAHGDHIVVKVNGTTSTELKNDPSRPEGHFALQMHAGCVMEVFFKEIEIQELP